MLRSTCALALALLFAAPALAQQAAPNTANDDDDDDVARSPPPFQRAVALAVGSSLGGRVGLGPAALGTVGISFRLFPHVEPELVLGAGVEGPLLLSTERVSFLQRFSIGARVLPWDDGLRPFGWLALHHGHAATVADAAKNPMGALLVSSDAGVAHLTGLEAGGGVIIPFAVSMAPLSDLGSCELVLRAGATVLPSFLGSEGSHRVMLLGDVALSVPIGF